MTDEKALVVKDDRTEFSIAEIEKIGSAIAKSGLFGMRTPEQAIALCLIAHAEGQHPATAALEYDIIQNRPSLKAKAMLARFQNSGGSVVWHQRDDEVAEATFKHPVGGEITVRWDMDRAKQAGLEGKDNWRKYPRAMLSARVISEGVSTTYPGAARFYTPEEVQDFDNDWNKGPKTVQGESKIIETTPEPESEPVQKEKSNAVADAKAKIEAANKAADKKEKPKSKLKPVRQKPKPKKASASDILSAIDPGEAAMTGDELDEEVVEKIVAGFSEFGMELANLEDWAKLDSTDWVAGTRENLGKLYLLLKDKEVTPEDVSAFIAARLDDDPEE